MEMEADVTTAVPLLLALLHIKEAVATTSVLLSLRAPVAVTLPC